MGTVAHHAIIITSRDQRQLKAAHQKAKATGLQTTEITDSPANQYGTFLVIPDGSIKGWMESVTGDMRRETLTQWLGADGTHDKDGRSSLEWCEVCYGADPGHSEVVRDGCLRKEAK